MPDRSVEARLESWFAESPAMPDAPLFAARVAERLDRAWGFRRVLIGSLGLLGGLIGGAQVVSGGMLARIDEAARPAGAALMGQVTTLFSDVGQTQGEALIMSVALAVFAAGLLVTRAIRDI